MDCRLITKYGFVSAGGRIYINRKTAAKAHGITPSTFYSRLERGWTMSDALTTPVMDHAAVNDVLHRDPHPQGKPIKHLGVLYPSRKALAEAYDIPVSSLCNLLRQGYSAEDAVDELLSKSRKRKNRVSQSSTVIRCFKAEFCSLSELARTYRVDKWDLFDLMSAGYSPEDAVIKAIKDQALADSSV